MKDNLDTAITQSTQNMSKEDKAAPNSPSAIFYIVVDDYRRGITANLDLVDITKKGHGAAYYNDPEPALIAALQAVEKHKN